MTTPQPASEISTSVSVSVARAALEGLAEASAAPLDRNHLGRLARMHSFCQTLAEAEEPSDAAAREQVRRLAASLVTALEKLILDEAARPDEALSCIPVAVEMLRQAMEGQVVAGTALAARLHAASTGEAVPAGARDPFDRATANASETVDSCSSVNRAPADPRVAKAAATSADQAIAKSATGDSYVSEPLVIDLNEREHLQGFIEESREHMAAIEAALLEVEQDPTDAAKINELFRPFHTIKGIAGFLNLGDIHRLAHEVETILDLGRKSELKVTPGTVDRIFAAVDLLQAQMAEVQSFLINPRGEVCAQPNISGMIAQLRAIAQGRNPALAAAQSPPLKLGEILVVNEAATPQEVEEGLEIQAREEPPPRKLGEILVEHGAVSCKQVDSALARQAVGKVAAQTIRVETAKLDTLVDAVGELVIAQTMVNLSEAIRGDARLTRDVSAVSKIVRDVQETVMGLRMVPIGPTFQKMKRLVRDVARKANKKVELHIRGEDTELDQTVIQQISDPLVHMVRNAVDHGIEPPDVRRQAGKPETGQLSLDAHHQGDSVVIEVCDDGPGLDPVNLIAKGRAHGLVGPDESLTDQQAFGLILQPGFSMAERVTDISGRGVGMDVVRRNVEQLCGKLEIRSEQGHGTTFLIRLPLTLAIIDGMLVRVGRERLIIPTTLIERSLRPQRNQITTVQRRGELLQVRGELCPLIQLGELFQYSGRIDPCAALVVIVHCEGQKIGVVVDELIGQQQVVIKSLAGNLKQVRGVSGAAILGDGRVGLILEPSGLLQLHSQGGRGGGRYTVSSAPDGRGRSPGPRSTSSVDEDACPGPPETASEPSRSVEAACGAGTAPRVL